MVTQAVGKRADGGTVKKAVIFRARDASGSLSIANAARDTAVGYAWSSSIL